MFYAQVLLKSEQEYHGILRTRIPPIRPRICYLERGLHQPTRVLLSIIRRTRFPPTRARLLHSEGRFCHPQKNTYYTARKPNRNLSYTLLYHIKNHISQNLSGNISTN
jgi:hypothetical protein